MANGGDERFELGGKVTACAVFEHYEEEDEKEFGMLRSLAERVYEKTGF